MRFFTVIVFCLPILIFAQRKPKKTSIRPDTSYHAPAISLSYFGEQIFHPGIRIGYLLHRKSLIKEKSVTYFLKGGQTFLKRKVKSASFLLSLATYGHFQNHIAFAPNAMYIRKTLYNNSIYRAHGFGIGTTTNLYLNATYSVNNQDQLKRNYLAGRSYFTIPLHFELGYDLEKQFQSSAQIFIRMGAQILSGYNAYILPVLHTELGYYFQIP